MQKSRGVQRLDRTGNNTLSLQPEISHLPHPPTAFLPPFPPPSPRKQLNSDIKLPNLEDLTGRLTGQIAKTNASTKKKQNRATGNTLSSNISKGVTRKSALKNIAVYANLSTSNVCLLCGMHCARADLLYAHLLVLAHNFLPQPCPDSWRFRCRRCGQRWDGEVGAYRGEELNRHGCIQQKAAYISQFMVPNEDLDVYGLPFMCLFCCAESSPDPRQYSQGRRRVKAPVRLCESAMRFHSKLHLAVHILCRHSTRARPDQCAECSYTISRTNKTEEPWDAKRFWSPPAVKPVESCSKTADISSSSESESDVPRIVPRLQDSILDREGLPMLERHLDETHWPVYKFLYWSVKQNQAALQTVRDGEAYLCPLCEIAEAQSLRTVSSPLGDTPSEMSLSVRSKRQPLLSNALFQTHVVCYHAGARQLDSLMGLCQICGHTDLMQFSLAADACPRRDPYKQGSVKHLIRFGHVRHVQQQFELCTAQQRVTPKSVHCVFDWSTTCVFCWRRFTTHLGPDCRLLQARCELQAHLLVTHCVPLRTRDQAEKLRVSSVKFNPCGWCGQTIRDSQMPEQTEPPEFLLGVTNSDSQWKRLYEQYCWQEAHEKQHADALYQWWKHQPFVTMTQEDQ